MQTEIVIAGFGGQGVLFAGQLLAYAGMDAGQVVTWIPSYGPEMRGGTANCTVIISDEEIGSPLVRNPRAVLALNLPSFDKYEPLVIQHGVLIVNGSLVNRSPQREDIHSVLIPANDIAESLGNRRLINVVMVGALLALLPVVSIDIVEDALAHHLPERHMKLLPLNVQALHAGLLQVLGRPHTPARAAEAIAAVRAAGFLNVNLDVMYGLPGQTLAEARADAAEGLRFGTTHFSAYQLTLEPNTVFYRKPPQLPEHDDCADMQLAVEELAAAAGFEHYETSAFARPGRRCRHNVNYWEFGDYLGIGAGAHGKLSFADRVTRHERAKQPREYMASAGAVHEKLIAPRELPFEFMLNALRLAEGVPAGMFEERTGLPGATILRKLQAAREKGLLEEDPLRVRPTRRGRQFLNDLLQLFLD